MFSRNLLRQTQCLLQHNTLQNTAHMLNIKDMLFQESAQVDPVALAAEEAKSRKEREDALQRAIHTKPEVTKKKSSFKTISQRLMPVLAVLRGSRNRSTEGDSMH